MEEQTNEGYLKPLNPRLNSASGGFTYSVAVIIYFVLSLAVSLILSLSNLEKGSDAYIYISYLVSPLTIGVCMVTVLTYKKINFKSIFPVKCHPKYYLIGLLLIFGLLFSLSWVNEVSVKLFKLCGYEPREAGSYFPNLSGGYVVLAVFVIAVIPAFCEELLFRGAILNACEQSMGTIRTIFVVGFCFALFHGSPEQTVYQFIAGCTFAFIAVRSHSILPSIIMHFINNAIIIIFGACNLFDETGNLIISDGGYIALMVISALAFIGGIVWLILDKKPLIKCEKGGVKSFFLFASLGICALGLLWILSLFGLN